VTAHETGHVVKREYEVYEFPMRLTLRGPAGGAPAAALTALKRHTHNTAIGYSAYGSPYVCDFRGAKLRVEAVQDAGNGLVEVVIQGAGVARRDRSRPTLKQQLEEEEEKEQASGQNGRHGVSEATRKAILKTHRVLKSHFASSVCVTCGARVLPGMDIGRPKKADAAGARGGWSHVACIARGSAHDGALGKRKRGHAAAGDGDPDASGTGRASAPSASAASEAVAGPDKANRRGGKAVRQDKTSFKVAVPFRAEDPSPGGPGRAGRRKKRRVPPADA
jgi:hypothetical protein